MSMVSAVFLEGWDECYSRLEEAVGHVLGITRRVNWDAWPARLDQLYKHSRFNEKYNIFVPTNAVTEASYAGMTPEAFTLEDFVISDIPKDDSNRTLLAEVTIISTKSDLPISYRKEYVFGRILPA